MVATLDSTSPSMGILHNKAWQRSIFWRYGEICTSWDISLLRLFVSLSSEHGISSGGLNTGDNLSESSFLFLVPQISRNSTDLCPMRARISQMMQMTQIFFASHLSPITIFRYKFDKMLIAKGFVCVTDGLKWGFIPHASVTILALSLTILLML